MLRGKHWVVNADPSPIQLGQRASRMLTQLAKGPQALSSIWPLCGRHRHRQWPFAQRQWSLRELLIHKLSHRPDREGGLPRRRFRGATGSAHHASWHAAGSLQGTLRGAGREANLQRCRALIAANGESADATLGVRARSLMVRTRRGGDRQQDPLYLPSLPRPVASRWATQR